MQKRSRHIILLAWLQVILLLFPTVVKTIHHHVHEIESAVEHKGAFSFSQEAHASSCPICDFEFVQYVQPSAGSLPDVPVAFCKLFCISLSSDPVTPVTLPSLRAPPVC